MNVEILITTDCPHEDAAVDLVGMAASALDIAPRVTVIEIADLEAAQRCGFVGSPTIRVDGRDVSPPPLVEACLSCRLYETTHGRSGIPEPGAVLAALKAALDVQHP